MIKKRAIIFIFVGVLISSIAYGKVGTMSIEKRIDAADLVVRATIKNLKTTMVFIDTNTNLPEELFSRKE